MVTVWFHATKCGGETMKRVFAVCVALTAVLASTALALAHSLTPGDTAHLLPDPTPVMTIGALLILFGLLARVHGRTWTRRDASGEREGEAP